jgi:hypothetical protein
MTPTHDLTLSLQQYFFWRASDRDAVYDKSGGVLRPGTGTTARYLGAEIDLLASYNLTRHLLGYAGYSRFFAGELIRTTGPQGQRLPRLWAVITGVLDPPRPSRRACLVPRSTATSIRRRPSKARIR